MTADVKGDKQYVYTWYGWPVRVLIRYAYVPLSPHELHQVHLSHTSLSPRNTVSNLPEGTQAEIAICSHQVSKWAANRDRFEYKQAQFWEWGEQRGVRGSVILGTRRTKQSAGVRWCDKQPFPISFKTILSMPWEIAHVQTYIHVLRLWNVQKWRLFWSFLAGLQGRWVS